MHLSVEQNDARAADLAEISSSPVRYRHRNGGKNPQNPGPSGPVPEIEMPKVL